MNTNYWSVDKFVDKLENYPQIQQAADLLSKNEVVAFPTETVYGLGGNAKDNQAVEKIFAAKGRPSDNPLIIHIAGQIQLTDFVEDISAHAQLLMSRFWPGPLTIIFPLKKGFLSSKATAGLETVAVRMPDHPVAMAILKASGLPIAAPSANRSGKPSPTTALHVKEDLDGRIAGIVDGGPTGVGVESTVIDCTSEIPVILRPGGVTKEQLEEVVGEVHVDPALADEKEAPKSPGMKYRHYAPDAPLYLIDGTREDIQRLINEQHREGRKVGVLTTAENEAFYDADYIYACGERDRLETVASSIYEALRSFNKQDVDLIYSEMFPNEGVGNAIMNRLLKAAGQRVIKG
ncbi:L-threonylcarbamoyladenylate synthase [Niallia endozanthoxylica]|uniref:Threonylcarbamoyl-AMP synthase n=1 Tax=Niallia endozanthoxylica TaxID=2036016 RepID=A0A5J5HXX0_9BACI|nr:L-threonylcarbamoyladenylate synthase [Niallia endozanthoxylica]KAA9027837.1 threonylcarbamoyl-AMP synthase [Niallia endozanthoxylica]